MVGGSQLLLERLSMSDSSHRTERAYVKRKYANANILSILGGTLPQFLKERGRLLVGGDPGDGLPHHHLFRGPVYHLASVQALGKAVDGVSV